MDLGEVLRRLAEQRPIFHSEADFQHALAWEIQTLYPGVRIRLEVPLYGLGGRAALDIVVEIEEVKYAIELKYCKAAVEAIVNREQFRLTKSGALDIFRYDVCKDIKRLEHALRTRQAQIGYVLVLSNDKGLWKDSGRQGVDQMFKIDEGRVLQGELTWSVRAGEGTTKDRELPISLMGRYETRWKSFSQLPITNGEFKILQVLVKDIPVASEVAADPEPAVRRAYQAPVQTTNRRDSSTFFGPLVDHIRGHYEITLSFVEIERLVGPLPASAYKHNAWWHGVRNGHPHAIWENEGFKASPKFGEGKVIFRKV